MYTRETGYANWWPCFFMDQIYFIYFCRWSPSDYFCHIVFHSDHWFQRKRFLNFVHYINITFPARVIVENIIPRNVIINQGAAEVDNHISRDDIFDFHPRRECNTYFIIPNRTLDPLFPEGILLLNRPNMVRRDPKRN